MITRIDYIVHPLYTLTCNRRESEALVERINRLIEQEGKDEKRLFMLNKDRINERCTTLEERKDHDKKMAELIALFHGKCPRGYIHSWHPLVDAEDNLIEDEEMSSFSYAFPRFMKSRKVKIDTANFSIVGHGVYKNGCVRVATDHLGTIIQRAYEVNVVPLLNDATCL